MIHINKKSQCCGCHACETVCPKKCISMIEDEEGFLYPKIEQEHCISCNACELVCPVLNKRECKEEKHPIALAAFNKNEKIRLESSSGGCFTEIAAFIICSGGVVFGAAMDENFQVKHIAVEKMEDLAKLRGSKYLQSIIGSAYADAKQFLDRGRRVLFTGTPCQINGLYHYLKKDYDNLITQDIICHGVPSLMVWKRYIDFREAKSGSKPRRIFFRHKKYGWKTYSVRFDFANCTEYEQIFSKDLFMKAFLSDLCLRPSCYDCSFKGVARQSDFTLADFWGVQNILPQLDDDKGISLVFLHSKKAQTLFGSIQNNLVFQKVDSDKAIHYNPAMIQSPNKPFCRKKFIKQIYFGQDFEKAVERNIYPSLYYRACGKIVRVLAEIKNKKRCRK